MNFGPIHESITEHHHEGVKVFEKKTDELVQRTEEVRKLLKGFIKYFQDSTILK